MIKKEKTLGQKKLMAVTMPKADKFWKKQLEGAIPTTFLPDFYEDNNCEVNYHSATIKIDSKLCEKLLDTFNASNIDKIFASAVISLIFVSYNGVNDDILVRYKSKMDDLNIPLRIFLDENITVQKLYDNLKKNVDEAEEHKKYPVDLLVNNINVAVNITSTIDYEEDYFDECSNLQFNFLKNEDGSFVLKVVGNSSMYLLDTIKALASKLIVMLEIFVDSISKKVLDINLLSEKDEYMYELLNDTETPFSDKMSIVDLIKRTFAKYPDRCAILDNGREITFSEFEKMAKKVAAFISKVSKDDDSVVGILCDRSVDFLAGVYGILLAGKAYLPLDAKAPLVRNETILKQSSTSLIICEDKYLDKVPNLVNKYSISEIKCSTYAYTDIEVKPDDLAYIIFTSGSTGIPKGVCVKQRSVVNRLEWMHRSFTLKESDVILHKTPTTFDVSVWELFWWAIIGGQVTLLTSGQEANPEAIIEAIEQNSVTTMHFVPSMLNAFLDYVKSTKSVDRIKTLKRIFSSGEALKPNHVNKFYEIFDNAKLINLYGPTEATVDVSYNVTKKGDNPVLIGKPIDNIRLYVIDTKNNKRPIGMVGELCIAGVGVANGYINDELRTNDRFKKISSLKEERVYLTGDLVRIRQDKNIEYFGRNDRQVKVRGFRIELGEIESAFIKQDYISDVVVLTNIGTDNIIHLFAYVILNNNSISKETIMKDVSKLLLNYMIPEKVIIVNSMPLTPNGKVDKKALLKLSNEEKNKDKILPSTEEERILSEIWREVLGIDEVGVNDNFFELGGNSINFVSVLALANKKGMKFTFQQLFNNPTITDLLNSTIEDDENEEFKEISNFELISEEDKAKMPDYVEDAYPMAMLQSGLVYQSTIMDGDNNYHDIVSYTIKGKIDVELFKKAVERLVETQPIFRTSYNLVDFSEYLQIVHKKVEKLPLNIYDLRGLKTDEEKEGVYQQWFWKEQHRPFNWSVPGLVQLHIHILSDNSYKYSISQHNSALDGWSMNQVHTFLFETYFELLEGKDINVKKLSSNNHNKTFIYLEQKALKSKRFDDFWNKKLKNVPNGKIPRGRAIDKKKGNEVVFHDIKLPDGLSEKIIKLANELKVPVKDILLASHIKFISLLSRNKDVFTGYEIGGRPELLGAENALGVFINTMPFRVVLDEQDSWKELIQKVYRTEGEFLPFRRYPMAKVKEKVKNRGVLFESVFNFTHFYSLKRLRNLPGFDNIDVRAAAITEFPLRVEYSRHFYNDEVELSLHYRTAQYDKEDMDVFGRIFIDILESMVYKTNEKHSELNVEKYLSKYNFYEQDNLLEEQVETVNKEETIKDKMLNPEFKKAVENVKRIWANVLKIPSETIELEDDFFLIGGSSIAALKASLFFQKKISLKTLMKKSKLYELAEELMNGNSNQVQDTNLLHCLTKATVSPLNIIFLPYAAGNAINFMKIAKEFEKNNIDVSVFAAELPGHDAHVKNDFVDFDKTTKMLADEIEVKMKGKQFIIWGHCVGTSLALSVTNQLEKKGIKPKKLYLAGKTFNNPNEFLEKLERAKKLKFEDIRELYLQWSGSNALSSLGEEYENNLVEIFKHDADESNKFLYSLWNENSSLEVKTPSVIVVTKDDQATINYQEDWKVWGKWINSINLKIFEKGGHYFLNTIEEEVVKYLLEDNNIK
ncbi:MAG: amino acid adenylation domain-containing protein [Clostridium sp.]|nr:amino acid adenylation domain-containing protein [Clostridium sp.]